MSSNISPPLTPPLVENPILVSSEAVNHAETENIAMSSTSEGDDDPEKLTARYLALKEKLYRFKPDLANTKPKLQALRLKGVKMIGKEPNPDPKIAKLQRKLDALESDILFDHQEAEAQWAETRILLDKQASERKRLQLQDGIPKAVGFPLKSPSTPPSTESGDTGPDEDDLGIAMVADLFASNNSDIRPASSQDSVSNVMVNVRDFGKPGGLKPRRVLEEACKARCVKCYFSMLY